MTPVMPGVFLGYAALIVLLYAAGHRAGSGSLERAVRACLTGLNAAANCTALLGLGAPAAAVAVLGLVNLGAAVPRLAASRPFAALLAWSSPAMPMSWPATVTGALVFVTGLATAPFGRPFRPSFDRSTATVIVHGGSPFLFRCGYDLGNFVFIHPDIVDEAGGCPVDLVAHETGHTLNVAAFGSVFHFLGALHENLGPPRGGAGPRAYAERLAESRRRAPGHPRLDAWPAASR